jgi:penicillin-insensitive murein endopeptidase
MRPQYVLVSLTFVGLRKGGVAPMNRRTSSLTVVPLASLIVMTILAMPAVAEPIAKKLFGSKKTPAALSARAIGSYARGCLAGGRKLPISGSGYEAMKLWRNRNWGHPQLIEFLERFANEAKEKDSWPGLLIGDLAQPRGGPMITGHKSHQIGLDADIWYRPKPAGDLSKKERADSWSIPLAEEFGQSVIKKNWKPGYVTLIRRAASDPRMARIFVHPAVKRALCEGAGSDRAWLRKIRPWWKHNFHFHVRLKCPAGYAGCKDQNPPPAGDGCGPQLKGWMKKLAAAEKWSKTKKKDPPKKKPKPRKELRMADLPPSCRAVLEAGAGSAPTVAVKQKAPVPKRKVAAPRNDPNLPWLSGVTTTPAPKAPPPMPLPARKPQ